MDPDPDPRPTKRRRPSPLPPTRTELSSRPKPTRSRPQQRQQQQEQTGTTAAPAPAAQAPTSKSNKSTSINNFFTPATESQRWTQKFEARPAPAPTASPEDEIEDYYDFDDDIFEQIRVPTDSATGGPGNGRIQPQSKAKATTTATATLNTNAKTKTKSTTTRTRSRRFLMPDMNTGSTHHTATATTTAAAEDTRPWFQRFAPANLDELAVHKRKVEDVSRWLEEVFCGRRMQKLLILRGPAGSGKTTTIGLLAQVLGYDIVEWRNPPVDASASAKEYVSAARLFEEFLGRGEGGGLDLASTEGSTDISPTNGNANANTTSNSPTNKDTKRILLLEEFPTQTRPATLTSFRTSLQRYLASPQGQSQTQTPLILILSETLLSTTDNITLPRLLGPALTNHPKTKIIDFNPIAPTFMSKALRLILDKESRVSRRRTLPSPAVLKHIAEIGDVRSAVSGLEFLCLKGVGWGGGIASSSSSKSTSTRKKTVKGAAASAATPDLTPMEEDSLKLISQREASLGLFHAVGKIVYNKREEINTNIDTNIPDTAANNNENDNDSDSDSDSDYDNNTQTPQPRTPTSTRPPSSVNLETLQSETGTDAITFIAALHENYPPSCAGPSFTDSLNSCIEALSDSDILTGGNSASFIGNRYANANSYSGIGASAELRQDEIAFHVAARGLLFGLPLSVKRGLGSGSGSGSGSGGGRPGTGVHKMMYPVSMRLWRKIEEVGGVVDAWMGEGEGGGFSHSSSTSVGGGTGDDGDGGGVSAWRSRGVGTEKEKDEIGGTRGRTRLRREDALLDYLPYLVGIRGVGGRLGRVVKMGGGVGIEGEEEDELEIEMDRERQGKGRIDRSEKVDVQEEEKLILSDDDIVD